MEDLKERLNLIREGYYENDHITLESAFSKIVDKVRGYSKEKFKELTDEYSKLSIKQLIDLYVKDIRKSPGLRLATNKDTNVKTASELTISAMKRKNERFQLFVVNDAPIIYNEAMDKIYCWAYIRGAGSSAHVINDSPKNIINAIAKRNSKL